MKVFLQANFLSSHEASWAQLLRFCVSLTQTVEAFSHQSTSPYSLSTHSFPVRVVRISCILSFDMCLSKCPYVALRCNDSLIYGNNIEISASRILRQQTNSEAYSTPHTCTHTVFLSSSCEKAYISKATECS